MPMSWRVRLRALSGATVRAMNQASGITVHAFIRPGTPASAGPVLVTQIVDLYEFGVIGPGSEVWANLDVPTLSVKLT